jgi:hypothetical protein
MTRLFFFERRPSSQALHDPLIRLPAIDLSVQMSATLRNFHIRPIQASHLAHPRPRNVNYRLRGFAPALS